MSNVRRKRFVATLVIVFVPMGIFGCQEEGSQKAVTPRAQPGKAGLPTSVKSQPPLSVTGSQGQKLPVKIERE